ncbi:hypothetical protein BDZ89DRAFT_1261592 [Hymenopellis radicata]|nr:hypothetical protein BDZ89DRAFT_1261592 [Hymenopellis radicata]
MNAPYAKPHMTECGVVKNVRDVEGALFECAKAAVIPDAFTTELGVVIPFPRGKFSKARKKRGCRLVSCRGRGLRRRIRRGWPAKGYTVLTRPVYSPYREWREAAATAAATKISAFGRIPTNFSAVKRYGTQFTAPCDALCELTVALVHKILEAVKNLIELPASSESAH